MTVEPSGEELSFALAWAEESYDGMPVVPSDWCSRERFDAQVRLLDGTSSPGWPYMRTATTISSWLKTDYLGVSDPQQLEVLWHDTMLVMAGTYDHYFRVFVKDEPHKRSKIEAGKWRLIVASSLPVQMAWRLCFSLQNDWLNSRPYETPSAHGLIFPHGGWRRFKAMLESLQLRWSRDISAWDVNAPGYLLRAVRTLRKNWGGPSDWLRVVDILYDDAFVHPKLLFSNGLVLQQEYEGFMKSGLYNTISDNSLCMVIQHFLASRRARLPVGNVRATGDDVLQQYWNEEYTKALEELGSKVKEVTSSPIFMGTDFTDRPKPVYFDKHIVNFTSSSVDLEDVLDSYARLYCYSEHLDFWVQVARELGLKIRSKSYCQFWYGSPLARLFYSDAY